MQCHTSQKWPRTEIFRWRGRTVELSSSGSRKPQCTPQNSHTHMCWRSLWESSPCPPPCSCWPEDPHYPPDRRPCLLSQILPQHVFTRQILYYKNSSLMFSNVIVMFYSCKFLHGRCYLHRSYWQLSVHYKWLGHYRWRQTRAAPWPSAGCLPLVLLLPQN